MVELKTPNSVLRRTDGVLVPRLPDLQEPMSRADNKVAGEPEVSAQGVGRVLRDSCWTRVGASSGIVGQPGTSPPDPANPMITASRLGTNSHVQKTQSDSP
jgi:hypothetical protein